MNLPDLPDDLGPFHVGEVVILIVDCWPLEKRAGEEVTIDSAFGIKIVTHPFTGVKEPVLGWLLLERSHRYEHIKRIIAQHGEVRRRKKPIYGNELPIFESWVYGDQKEFYIS